MNILALETSTRMLSAALSWQGTVYQRQQLQLNGGSDLLLPWVQSLLTEAGTTLTALDGIAFGAGPGGFTGLRLACGVAQGLAYGAGLKVVPVSCLLALAEAQMGKSDRVYACIDARMNEVYTAAYQRIGDDWREVLPPVVSPPEVVPLPDDGASWLGCGDGWQAYPAALATRLAGYVPLPDVSSYPSARDVLNLAIPVFERDAAISPALAQPIYVRDKVALTTAERLARGGLR